GPSFLEHIAAFVLMGVIPFQSLMRGQIFEVEEPLTTQEKFSIYKANSFSQWFISAILVGIWFLSGKNFYDLGFRWPQVEDPMAVWLLSGTFLMAYLFDAWWQLRNKAARIKQVKEWSKYTPFLPTTGKQMAGFLMVVITAAICEEILFRGFLIHYLFQLLDHSLTSTFIAVLLPSIIFASSHMYQGWQAVAKIAILATVFSTLLILTGSLIIPIILHFLVNLFSGLLGVFFWEKAMKESTGMQDFPQ
ncbi:MAG: CPBP family intramembrane metalloprotease, partial [Saprospiraceae bacterium]|nr:CPBP family intramembrane metalloprotease [Saprospiraceae bacterium]